MGGVFYFGAIFFFQRRYLAAGRSAGAFSLTAARWGLPLGIASQAGGQKNAGDSAALFTAAAVKLRVARLQAGMAFRHIAAAGVLCDTEFTMSIFISNLAFWHGDPTTIMLEKVGTLSG